ncbi:glycoside hydrolase family 19 protein [Lysobacter sp. Hz 25]|uniref:glycoside hydrolase family 19 protein n=1 Tax=Lysobacter sp. Hz 25 TaxID=3383698 RepID=UPI0038D44FAA
MFSITPDLLVSAVGCTRTLGTTWAKHVAEACRLAEVSTPARLAFFLAQIGHESMGLSRTVENLNYSAEGLLATWPKRFSAATAAQLARKPQLIAEHVYGGRLGNREAGDGWRYRGRGLIQNTGRANYEAVRDALRAVVQPCPDFVKDPDALAEPRYAALAAGSYWKAHNLNELADKGDFDASTRRINGGMTGAADRRERYDRAKQALRAMR